MKQLIKISLLLVCLYNACLSTVTARPLLSPYIGGDFKMEQSVNLEEEEPKLRLGSAGIRAGMDIGEFFGTEARYGKGVISDSGTVTGLDNTEFGINYYAAAFGKIQTPIYDDCRVYGLFGIARVSTEAKIDVLGITATETFGDTDFAWGIGANYFFNENWAMNLEYLKLNRDIEGINSGISYHF
jgi:opacity protein-like surface antigen